MLVIMNTAMGAAGIHLGSQKKHGDGTTADTIFITGTKATIPDVFADADVTTAHLCEIASGDANSTYLLNCSIQVNESGILVIDTTCDWLWLSSIDGAIANITSYGRLFINDTLVTAMVPATGAGGLNASSANDTTFNTGAKTRPSIRVNNSEGDGDGAFGLSSARIAYLGGDINESYGGICINDTGGSPLFTATNTHISHCYNGLFIKSIIVGETPLSNINVTNCNVFGIRIDADSAVNFTNVNSTNNGVDWYTHNDVVSTINNTQLSTVTKYFLDDLTDTTNITQGNIVISRKRGNTAWNITSRDVQFTTSDNDYVIINMSSTSSWTGQTDDADFLGIVLPGFGAGNEYSLSVNDWNENSVADANGHLTFNYTGTWSTKTFAVSQKKNPISTGGGSTTTYTTYYRCSDGNVISQVFASDPGGDWSTSRPDCTTTITVPPPLSTTGEGEVEDTVVMTTAIVIIIACLAIWKVPWFNRFGQNKWLLLIGIIVLALIALGMW